MTEWEGTRGDRRGERMGRYWRGGDEGKIFERSKVKEVGSRGKKKRRFTRSHNQYLPVLCNSFLYASALRVHS